MPSHTTCGLAVRVTAPVESPESHLTKALKPVVGATFKSMFKSYVVAEPVKSNNKKGIPLPTFWPWQFKSLESIGGKESVG